MSFRSLLKNTVEFEEGPLRHYRAMCWFPVSICCGVLFGLSAIVMLVIGARVICTEKLCGTTMFCLTSVLLMIAFACLFSSSFLRKWPALRKIAHGCCAKPCLRFFLGSYERAEDRLFYQFGKYIDDHGELQVTLDIPTTRDTKQIKEHIASIRHYHTQMLRNEAVILHLITSKLCSKDLAKIVWNYLF